MEQLGLKTGSTSLALYNLSASATRDNLSLIAVIMKAPTSDIRFKNAKTLLDYGFKNYSFKQFAKKGDIVENINVSKGIEKSVNVIFNSNAGILIKNGKEGEVVQKVQLEKNIYAPIEKGQKLGCVVYMLDGENVYTVDLIAEKDVPKENFSGILKFVYKKWFCICRD